MCLHLQDVHTVLMTVSWFWFTAIRLFSSPLNFSHSPECCRTVYGFDVSSGVQLAVVLYVGASATYCQHNCSRYTVIDIFLSSFDARLTIRSTEYWSWIVLASFFLYDFLTLFLCSCHGFYNCAMHWNGIGRIDDVNSIHIRCNSLASYLKYPKRSVLIWNWQRWGILCTRVGSSFEYENCL